MWVEGVCVCVCVCVWSVTVGVWGSYFKEVLSVRTEGWVEHEMMEVRMLTRLVIVVVNKVLNVIM